VHAQEERAAPLRVRIGLQPELWRLPDRRQHEENLELQGDAEQSDGEQEQLEETPDGRLIIVINVFFLHDSFRVVDDAHVKFNPTSHI
jgi:hypothetical protein